MAIRINSKAAQQADGAVSTGTGSAMGSEGGISRDVDRRVELVAISQLTPNRRNARTHSRKQIQLIAASIKRFGFNNPVLVDQNGELIAGHGRVEAAKLLGFAEVPTLRIGHLSAAEKRAYIIADNRMAELAGWNLDTLAIELGDLLDLEFEVELTGFGLDEIQNILDIPDEDAPDENGVKNDGAENDFIEPCSGVPVSRSGDEWLLGQHRLVCGNSSDDGAYAWVDSAVHCWQILAGSAATLAGTTKTFAEIAAERGGPHDGRSDHSVSAKREAA